jgi:hypothetical protein
MKKLVLLLLMFSGVVYGQTEKTLLLLTGASEVTLDTDATITLAVTDCNNELRVNSDADAIDYTLPDVQAGLCIMFYDKGGGVITVDAAAGDVICLDGTDLTAANAIDSPGDTGDFICLFGIDNNFWVSLGRSGTWVDGGAD